MSSPAGRALLLFVFFHALYALTSSGNVFRVPDEFEVYFQTEHLVDAGDLSVPQTLAIKQPVIEQGRVVGETSMFFGEIGRDGKPYAPYGPLVAILALPHHLVGRLVAALAGIPRAPLPTGIAWLVVVGGITMLSTATAAALAVAGCYRALLAVDTPEDRAFTLAMLLGGATVLWPYGTSFFSEAWQAAAFVWAAAFLLEARGQPAARAGWRVAAASILITCAGLTKVTSLVFAPGFVVAPLFDTSIDRRTRLLVSVRLAVAVAIAVVVHVVWNVHRFGKPFDFGYDWAETIPHLPARAFLPSDIPRGLAVLLLSPGKSLLLWAPALVLAIIGARRFAARQPAATIGIAVAGATGLVFYAAYLFPEGGYAHGPRNLVPILPLLLLPAGGPGPARWPRPLVVACAVVGAAIALTATAVSFLEDQNMGADLSGAARTTYYERIDPPPGRVWNRYRLDYIPFVDTIRSPGWLHATTLGQGPDYFPLHLLQARRQAPNGDRIPMWLIAGWPIAWAIVVLMCSVRLQADRNRSG